jgi:hypothetical protein
MATPEPDPPEVDDADPIEEPIDTQATEDYVWPDPAGVDTMAPEGFIPAPFEATEVEAQDA